MKGRKGEIKGTLLPLLLSLPLYIYVLLIVR